MAKWGEGDPRWIVEERADATNVNNWHWTEKDASAWSKTFLIELLSNVVYKDKCGTFHVSEVSSVTGEASANNRKSKLIFFYEWVIKLEWKGRLDGMKEDEKGTIEIPNLSEENSAEEVDVIVFCSGVSDRSSDVKQFVHRNAPEVIREKITEYVRLLKEEYSQDLLKPTPESEENHKKSAHRPHKQEPKSNIGLVEKVQTATDLPEKIVYKDLTVTEVFQTTAEELFSALTCPSKVEAFTRSDEFLFENSVGGKFRLFQSSITGENLELKAPLRIVQKWRASKWPPGHYSTLTMTLKEDSTNGTTLHIQQQRVPAFDVQSVKEGWKKYYFDPLKITFGFGAKLFF